MTPRPLDEIRFLPLTFDEIRFSCTVFWRNTFFFRNPLSKLALFPTVHGRDLLFQCAFLRYFVEIFAFLRLFDEIRAFQGDHLSKFTFFHAVFFTNFSFFSNFLTNFVFFRECLTRFLSGPFDEIRVFRNSLLKFEFFSSLLVEIRILLRILCGNLRFFFY